MPWAPGQSGNPNGYKGPRERRRKEVFDIIKNLGHKDALETLSYLQHNEQIEPGLRIAAAAALAPYCHPKMQATPTPRYVELQIDVPDFTSVNVAEDFLARILSLVAKGHLDIGQGQEVAALAKMYIDTQYQRDELAYKINPPQEHDVRITVQGGLPQLPGCENLIMPQLNGHTADARALAAPMDVAPNEFTPGELKAQGPHPLQQHHFAPGDAPQSRSDEPGQNSTTNGCGPQDGP
jgi:hypothetical protein